jgi:hypothetical protein
MSLDDLYDDLVNEPNRYMVLDENPEKDDALIFRLQHDLATKMHNSDEIAKRYRLRNKDELREYLRAHPQIVVEAMKIRAAFNSEDGSEARVRTKFLRATEDLIIPIHHLVKDPHTPISARIDGFKQLQRGAGVDGAPTPAAAALKGGGSAFNLTINFAGGRSQNISGTTVTDPNSIPTIDMPKRGPVEEDGYPGSLDIHRRNELLAPPPTLSVGTTGSDDDEPVEEI